MFYLTLFDTRTELLFDFLAHVRWFGDIQRILKRLEYPRIQGSQEGKHREVVVHIGPPAGGRYAIVSTSNITMVTPHVTKATGHLLPSELKRQSPEEIPSAIIPPGIKERLRVFDH